MFRDCSKPDGKDKDGKDVKDGKAKSEYKTPPKYTPLPLPKKAAGAAEKYSTPAERCVCVYAYCDAVSVLSCRLRRWHGRSDCVCVRPHSAAFSK